MRRSKKGFTLIEIMLAVVIVAILATIAIPSVTGAMNSAYHSVDNANAGLYESALKIYVSQKAQQREYVNLPEEPGPPPGHQDLVANSIALVINDGIIVFECKTKNWAFYYSPTTLQVIAKEYQGLEYPAGMIALTDITGEPIIGHPTGDLLQE